MQYYNFSIHEDEPEFKDSPLLSSIPELTHTLNAYQSRVFLDAVALEGQVEELAHYMKQNTDYSELSKQEQERLKQQLSVMRIYLSILTARIINFK